MHTRFPLIPLRRAVKLSALCILSLTCLHSTHAVILADYDFGTVEAPSKASADIDTNSSASDFSWGVGLGTVENWPNSTSAVNTAGGNPAPSYYVKSPSSVTQSDSVEDNRYWTFTVTPNPGVELDLTSFSFDLNANSTRPISYFLSSNADGFSNPISGTVAEGVSTDSLVTFDFTSIPSLQNLVTPIEFRLYLYAPQGGSAGSATTFDNIVLAGDISIVPEPGTFCLLLIGGAGTILFRRRLEVGRNRYSSIR